MKKNIKTFLSLIMGVIFLITQVPPVLAMAAETTTGDYTDKKYPGLVSSFGWEGDKHAPIAFIDGSYKLRDKNNLIVRFGLTDITSKIKWYNHSEYLPCFVSEYSNDSFKVKVENFADKVNIKSNDYEIAYSRYTVTNISNQTRPLPEVSKELIPLNDDAKNKVEIKVGETIVRDYAIGADRFGKTYEWPQDSEIASAGSYDSHFDNMKNYWNGKLDKIAKIESLPNKDLINAYKAGYIYTQIIKDGKAVHVGENGYDKVYDHDTIGIVSTLFTLGDFSEAKDLLETLPAQLQFDDAKWKYSWPFAIYLRKTGDKDYIKSKFNEIKTNTHKIETDRIDNGKGIIKQTYAIDSTGHWTIDNWAALFGLLSYRYVCEQLDEKEELKWATEQYDDLLNVVNKTLSETINKYSLNYIPVSMVEPNDYNRCDDPRDANWASMFLFGRWAWDGYLFNGHQEGVSFEKIDDTYTYGFNRTKGLLEKYNFGGYPHGIYSSAYNAGYGSAGLAGEKYRDLGIKAYEFMINNTMSGPFGWWEGINYKKDSSPWDRSHAPGGGGSCQHMWGQAVNTKVLFDSLIAEKVDGKVIIGRGVPTEWLEKGQNIKISNYGLGNNKHIGFNMTSQGKEIKVSISGDNPENNISLEMPFLKRNIESVSTGKLDNEKGTVEVSKDTKEVTIKLKNEATKDAASQELSKPTLKEVTQKDNGVEVVWDEVKDAEGYVIEYKTNNYKTNRIDAKKSNKYTIGLDKLYPNVNYEFKVYAYAGNKESEKSNPINLKIELPKSITGGDIEMKVDAPEPVVDLTKEGTLDWIRAGKVQNIRVERKANTKNYITLDSLQKNAISIFKDSPINFIWSDGTNETKCDESRYGLVFNGEDKSLEGKGDGYLLTVPADTKERVLRIYTSVYKAKASISAYLSDNSAEIKIDSLENKAKSEYKVFEIRYKAKNDGQKLYVKSTIDEKYISSGNNTFIAATLQGEPPVEVISNENSNNNQGEQKPGEESKPNENQNGGQNKPNEQNPNTENNGANSEQNDKNKNEVKNQTDTKTEGTQKQNTGDKSKNINKLPQTGTAKGAIGFIILASIISGAVILRKNRRG
ncbi:Fibronectin type III domain-containing protein [Clostridium cavendishii DSM 21758]|uniref:Fibronectin type III domain-containing protein n=1 Tax=Clostridium cavendishii DSM 21758 TaxID=1121302 RepID=A0A1M6GV49_9CLOT|nr:fibronectin type III domain-containing protein [Clostridium cavendishii]SHJ13838.1 Fibronectin type III domain-containing protein [Clostridium cavendishii DSM 21758]